MFQLINTFIVGLLISSARLYTLAVDVDDVIQNMHVETYIKLEPDNIATLMVMDANISFQQSCNKDDARKCFFYANVQNVLISVTNLQSGLDITTSTCGILNDLAESLKKTFAAFYDQGILKYVQVQKDEDLLSQQLKLHLFRAYDPELSEVKKSSSATNPVDIDTIHEFEPCKVHYLYSKRRPLPDGYLFEFKKKIDMSTCDNINIVNLTLDNSCSDLSTPRTDWQFYHEAEVLLGTYLMAYIKSKTTDTFAYKPWKDTPQVLVYNRTMSTDLIEVKKVTLKADMDEENSKRILFDSYINIDDNLFAQSDKGGLIKLYRALACSTNNYQDVDAALIKIAIQCATN